MRVIISVIAVYGEKDRKGKKKMEGGRLVSEGKRQPL